MLTTEIKPVAELTPAERRSMFYLMASNYDNVCQQKFIRDLEEKDGAILIRDANNQIQGLSTYKVMACHFRRELISVIVSGDTIINPQFWGSYAIFYAFAELIADLQSQKRLYWLLLSKGIRTYLMLPLFFHNFYPDYRCPTPEYESALISHLARSRYTDAYIEEQGILFFEPAADCLNEKLAAIPEGREQNPHVQFFLQKNPGYTRGNELVCLADLDRQNWRRQAWRIMNR